MKVGKFIRTILIVFAILLSLFLVSCSEKNVDPEGSSETAPTSTPLKSGQVPPGTKTAEKTDTASTSGNTGQAQPTEGPGGASPPRLISKVVMYLVILLSLLALGLLMFLVFHIFTKVTDLHCQARDNPETEFHLVKPVRKELDSLREKLDSLIEDEKTEVAKLRDNHETELAKLRGNLESVATHLNTNFGKVQEHLEGTREAVGQQQEEMVNIRKLANDRSKEIELYQEGIRLSSLKGAMDQVIKGLDCVRESLGATVDDEGKTAGMSGDAVKALETVLKEALLAAGVEEYGAEFIGRPYEGHEKDHVAIPNETVNPDHGPGIITACSLTGYRHLVSSGKYVDLRVAEVKVNPSTEHKQSVGGKESA